MSQGRLLVACDFGTTTFRAIAAEISPGGQLEVLGCAQEKAEGFQDGDFVNLAAGSRCVARVVRALEKQCDIYVSGFVYNIAGSHLRSVRATAQVPIGPGPRPIRAADVDEAKNRARSMAIPFDHRILTVTPVEYAVDRVRGVVDPAGRVGSQLEMQAHVITGSRSVLHNIERAVETARYRPLAEEVDVLAAGEALVTAADREAGAMLVDIGGHATNWAVYRKGAVIATGSVPLGGHHLSSDLAHGLRIPLDEAEGVKRSRGVVLRSLVGHVPIEALFEKEKPEDTPGIIAAILEPRCEEILAYVKKDFGDRRELASLGAGVILTGGGARCRGTAELCEEVFDLPAECRWVPPVLRGAERLPRGQWATAIGLSLCVARDTVDAAAEGDPRAAGPGLIGRLKGLLRRGGGAPAPVEPEELEAEA
ncbi:MAG TPA: cell division protein FtsA [Candidatus Krumholzibacteria bacterium]|nr:cell division protein FtsA [Candidatus Krumholzibacteria bacterium]